VSRKRLPGVPVKLKKRKLRVTTRMTVMRTMKATMTLTMMTIEEEIHLNPD